MVEKYIIDKSDIHKLLTGQDIELDCGCKARAFFIEIQGNPTNGDMIKAMFPKYRIQVSEALETVNLYYDGNEKYPGTYIRFDLNWWNAPYKLTQTLGDADQSGLEYADMPTV